MNLLEILKKNADNAKSYIDGLVSKKQDTLTFDTAPTEGSQNPVTSDGIQKAIAAKTVDLSNYPTKNGTGASGTWGISITGNASTATKATQDASGNIIIDTYATKAALSTKQEKLTFDTTPTNGSTNPVTSDGIKKAIDAKTIDLSNYYTKAQVDSAISTAISAIVDADNKSY